MNTHSAQGQVQLSWKIIAGGKTWYLLPMLPMDSLLRLLRGRSQAELALHFRLHVHVLLIHVLNALIALLLQAVNGSGQVCSYS